MSDKRIYVAVVRSVKTKKRTVKIPCGMACAQTAHVVSKLRLEYVLGGKDADTLWKRAMAMATPITTIVKQCRDVAEIRHIGTLAAKNKLHVATFEDTNEGLYGDDGEYTTAIAIGPCKKEDVEGILDYLPLWNCDHEGCQPK